MKVSKQVLEHYLASLLVAGVAIWQTGHHTVKAVAWGALVAVLGPVANAAYNHFKTVANTPTK